MNKHSAIPENDDQAFVVRYEHFVPTDEEKFIRLFISTKSLLRMSSDADCIHADATCKLKNQGYPVLVVGTTDKARAFHLLDLAIAKHETSVDYAFLFEAVKSGIKRVADKELKPKALVCDAVPAIRNGLKEVFPENPTIIMCYAHVMSNVKRYAHKNQDNRPLIRKDMEKLHFINYSTLELSYL